jgi:para-aminobenzoate synthetase/4-amino-4-deoxychorismate lyase
VSDDAFEFFFSGRSPQHFTRPEAVFAAYGVGEAWGVLHDVECLRAQGFAVAGFLSYELGASCVGLDAPERSGSARDMPLLLLAAFAPTHSTLPQSEDSFTISPLRPRLSQQKYAEVLGEIAHGLHEGDVYQVNATVPFDFTFTGNPRAGFARLLQCTQAPYAAYLRFDAHALVSLSPELFLRFDETSLTTKPMKGTAGLEAIAELSSNKNRAEHVMIVDLLRNDLSIICDRVRVERLFEEELYPTFATITSTISGDLRSGTPFAEIVRALFPCGSITGAPKRAAMQMIANTERWSREAYCGAIGYLLPDGTGEWNVAIRTLQLDCATNKGRLDLGGGIVADSEVASEWRELELKGRFIDSANIRTHDRV